MHGHSLLYSRLITTVPFNYLNQPTSLLLWTVAQRRLVVTYVTGRPIDPIFLNCLTLEDGINRLSRNVGNYQPTLRNIPEERWSHLHRAWSPKSRCRSVTCQQLCMSDACKFTQLFVFNFTHTYCVCVCVRVCARARVLTNKLYIHVHTSPAYIYWTYHNSWNRRQKGTNCQQVDVSTRWQKTPFFLCSLQIPHGLVYRLNVAKVLKLSIHKNYQTNNEL